jgi:predicted metal-dependent RNase
VTTREAMKHPNVWIPVVAAGASLLSFFGAIVAPAVVMGRHMERVDEAKEKTEKVAREIQAERSERISEIANIRQIIREDGRETRAMIESLGRRIDHKQGMGY